MNPDNIFREVRKICRKKEKSFPDQCLATINEINQAEIKDDTWLNLVAECIPRLFAADVSSGYTSFHNKDVIKKVWNIYNDATQTFVTANPFSKYKIRHCPPFNIACITGVFWDDVAPTKALVDFALNLDRQVFNPCVISTNQFFTIERKSDVEIPDSTNTKIGQILKENNIQLISIKGQECIRALSEKLITICLQQKIDIVVSNGSLFSFPEACLARSDSVGSFFNMHQGFPLYVNNIDAILHYLPQTRKTQLELWEQSGNKIIDYEFGISIPELPSNLDNKEKIYLITVSNHLSSRLSSEFCNIINATLNKHSTLYYTLIGSGDKNKILNRFSPSIRNRIEWIGPLDDQVKIFAYLFSSDIFVNEFPIGGGRVLLEAMAAELPVVAMRCGDLHVENMGASLVGDDAIPTYSEELYESMLENLINSKNERLKLGTKMRRRVENKYDIQHTVTNLAKSILTYHAEKFALKVNSLPSWEENDPDNKNYGPVYPTNDSNLRLLYIRQRNGAPIIRDIDSDIINAFGKKMCRLNILDLTDLVRLQDEKKWGEIESLQQKYINEIKEFKPDFAIGYNTTGIMQSGKDHLLEKLKIPYVGLFFDNPFYFQPDLDLCCNKDRIHIFGIDPYFFPMLNKIGFQNTHYFPIATSLHHKHVKQTTSGNDVQPISFIGTIKPIITIDEFVGRFNGIERDFAIHACKCILDNSDYQQDKIITNFTKINPRFTEKLNDQLSFQKLWFAIDIQLTSMLRIKTVNELSNTCISIFGNSIWQSANLNSNAQLKGYIQYGNPICQCYAEPKIIVNRSPLNLQNAIQQRCFDVGACRGFILTDYRPILEKHFEIGRDIEVYKSFSDLKEKVEFYLNNEKKRNEIAHNLHDKVISIHTWDSRIDEFLLTLSQISKENVVWK